MKNVKTILMLLSLVAFNPAFAEGDHADHGTQKEKSGGDHKEEGHGDHKEEGHGDHKEEGHGDHKEEGHGDHKEEGHGDHKEEGHGDHKEEGHGDHKEEGHGDHDEGGDDHKEEGHGDHKEEGHGDHEEGGGKAIGKGKAIEDVNKKKGLKLSKEAVKTLGIKLSTVDSSVFNISKATLVTSKSEKGIYRFKDGYFKFLPIETIKENEDGYQVSVEGIDFGDQIVVNGVGLLRVTDVYSTDKSDYGHSH